MKIGIVTFHNALNVGAVLQAYALQTYLLGLGHTVEFINYCPPKRFAIKDYLAKSPKIMIEKIVNIYNYKKYSKHAGFNKILKISHRKYQSYYEIEDDPPIYDLYIAGSDQIWNFYNTLSPIYLLSFVPIGKKKIAYSASLGQCQLHKSIQNEFKKALLQFDAISIREKNGVEFITELLDNKIKIYHTVDPTLLLPQEKYKEIIEPIIVQDKEYICSYILAELDKENEKIINYVKRTLDINIINLRNPDTCVNIRNSKNIIVTPKQWLNYILNSKIVICCSFHAVVFSLLFHKPFIVISPPSFKSKGGNMRINSLLNDLGLNNHIINTFNKKDIDTILSSSIEWDEIDKIINQKKEFSSNFLISNLK